VRLAPSSNTAGLSHNRCPRLAAGAPVQLAHRKKKTADCYTATPGRRLQVEPYRLLCCRPAREAGILAYWQIDIDQRAEAQHHALPKQYGKCSHRLDPAGRASLAAQSIDRAMPSPAPPRPNQNPVHEHAGQARYPAIFKVGSIACQLPWARLVIPHAARSCKLLWDIRFWQLVVPITPQRCHHSCKILK